MKNLYKLIGIIAIVAVIGFSMIACDDGGGGGGTHTHSYSTTWSKNATQHWHECSCGDKTDIANHIGNPCTACGYSSSGQGVAPTITTTSLQNGAVGTAYSQTLTATGDTPITWSIDTGTLPTGLNLSGNVISGTPSTTGTYNFTVKATNATGYDTQALSITIASAGSPVITTTTLPNGTVGTAYNQTLTATGNTSITWSIDTGTLPTGLNLSGNVISGTPSTTGTYNFTVKATNAAGYDTQAFTLIVNYPSALTPSATISGDVTINARLANTEGTGGYDVNSGSGVSIYISLTNVRFNETIAVGTDVSGWFSPTVGGLNYKISSNEVNSFSSTFYIQVTGTPTATSTSAITLTLPAGKLNDSNGNPTITNNLAVTGGAIAYNIDRAPENIVRIGSIYYTSLQAAIASASNVEIIVVKSFALSSTVSIPQNSNVTLKAGTDGLTISAEGSLTGSLFSVTGTLTIGNGTGGTPGSHSPKLIINGEGSNDDSSHIIRVNGWGRFNMYNGAELRNAHYSGIFLYGSSSSVKANAGMVGGVIAGCYEGVRAWGYADFTMTNGVIYGTGAGAPNTNTDHSIRVESGTTATVLGSNLAIGTYTQTYGTAP